MRFASWLVLASSLVAEVGGAEEPGFRLDARYRQAVVVAAADWSSTDGTLQRWRRGASGRWRAVGHPVTVRLGRAGLGWGRGEHPQASAIELGGPDKSEGDGRSPAGVFRLEEAIGHAPTSPRGGTLRYRQASDRLRCVDDVRSLLYNQVIETPASGTPSWSSDETMRRADGLYAWAILVEHNRRPVAAGQGSCIFLHIDARPSAATLGCTTMARAQLERLLTWLRVEENPVLVQLPKAVYRRVAIAWRLPPLASAGATLPRPRR